MTTGALHLLVPQNVGDQLARAPNTRIDATSERTGPDLTWDDVQKVAAVVTIVGGIASAPAQISKLVDILVDYASSQPTGAAYVIEGPTDNQTVEVKGPADRKNLEEALSNGVVWDSKKL